MLEYDVLYYWDGGRVRGHWIEVRISGSNVDEKIKDIEQLGYVTVRGCTSIGPPYGAPGDARFKVIGL